MAIHAASAVEIILSAPLLGSIRANSPRTLCSFLSVRYFDRMPVRFSPLTLVCRKSYTIAKVVRSPSAMHDFWHCGAQFFSSLINVCFVFVVIAKTLFSFLLWIFPVASTVVFPIQFSILSVSLVAVISCFLSAVWVSVSPRLFSSTFKSSPDVTSQVTPYFGFGLRSWDWSTTSTGGHWSYYTR